MRILLIGASGQIGSALRRTLPLLADLIVIDRTNLDFARPEHVRQRVMQAQPNLIVNAAAYTDVEGAENDETAAFMVNADSVGELALAARDLGATLVHYSTDYVFDGLKPAPYDEDDDPHPLSVYGRSKLEGEQRIRNAGCPHLILRTSWVYAAQGRNFLSTMLRLGRERPELRIVDDQVGAPTYARFIAEATADLLMRAATDGHARNRLEEGDTVHLVSEGTTSWFGFAGEIFAKAQAAGYVPTPRLVPVRSLEFPSRVQRPRNSRLSLARAKTVWGLHPPTWQQSLSECVDELGFEFEQI